MLNDEVKGDLRQGDICEVPYYPAWNLKRVQTTTDGSGTITGAILGQLGNVAQGGDGGTIVAIASQCCDLRPTKRAGVLIAPIRRAPIDPRNQEMRAEIRASDDRNEHGEFSHISLFPLELPSHPEELLVVDLSLMTAMMPSKEAIDLLQGQRKYQMDRETRDRFRIKLAALVGRPPADDGDAPA